MSIVQCYTKLKVIEKSFFSSKNQSVYAHPYYSWIMWRLVNAIKGLKWINV
jgi:hypothetical protein